MSERLKKLFNARDLLKEALTWDWSEATKAELAKRLDRIETDINGATQDYRIREEHERDVEQNYKDYKNRGC